MNLSHYAAFILFLLGCLFPGRSLQGAEPANKLPNIVVILADDLGYGDVGCYGGKIPTPHVDRLAKEGMRFTDAHSGSSVCSPTRYGLLTGRYAWRTSWMKRGVLAGFDPPLIEASRLTVAELLRRQGYVTACVGKWHLGFDWRWLDAKGRPPLSTDFSLRNLWDNQNYPVLTEKFKEGPCARGFDVFFGQTAPNQNPFCFIDQDRLVGIPKDVGEKKFGIRNRPVALKDTDILPTLVMKAVAFVDEQAKKDKPFFLYFPLTSPHSPVAPSVPFRGKSGAGAIGDFLMETDAAVGAILAALDKHRIADSTLVVFTSDNGHIRTEPALEKLGHRGNGPLRGSKGAIYEGGHRVPYVVRWPGVVRAGATSAEPTCHTHLLATCAELLKVQLPKDAGEDSFSILPIWRGERPAQPTHPLIVHQSVDGLLAIRQGRWKWIQGKELFDLNGDLSETKDMAGDRPHVVRQLRALLEKTITAERSRP